MAGSFAADHAGKAGALRSAPEDRNYDPQRGLNRHMKPLLLLSRLSSGRVLLHMICLGRCLALKSPDRRVRVSFHWEGAKRELKLSRGNDQGPTHRPSAGGGPFPT